MTKTTQKPNSIILQQGMPNNIFIIILIIVLAAVYLNKLPDNMIGAFAVMMVLGTVLGKIGNHTPILKDYLGGGPLVCIFGMATLVHYGLIPQPSIQTISTFMKNGGFLNFYIAALITGSILGIKSELLIKAGARYAVPLLLGIAASIALAAAVGAVTGYGSNYGIINVAMPIMGGGMGAGAVPMSEIYSDFLKKDVAAVLSVLIPALALGNVLSIIAAGLLDKLGSLVPALTGNGHLMKNFKPQPEKDEPPQIALMGTGLLTACTFFIIGNLLNILLPAIHPYALMIISVAVCKITGIVPPLVQKGANQWYKFVAKNFTMPLLIGIGCAYTNLTDVINAFSFTYILLVAGVVCGAVIGAGLGGKLVGFHSIESAITAGLCMANMGGTGDVAVLAASKRMNLMAFAQISSRLGGALMLLIATFLLPLLV